jgi:glycosyltransferase involved in cell wall biosynthesis
MDAAFLNSESYGNDLPSLRFSNRTTHMLEGRDLIIFGGDWGWFPSVMEQLAYRLAERNRILWVGSVSIRKPRLRFYDFRRVASRFSRMFSIEHNLHGETVPSAIVHPLVIPLYDIPLIKRLNDRWVRNALLKRIKDLNFRDVIALPSTPMVADVVGSMNESSMHYFCLDDYSQYEGAYTCVQGLEERILEKADSSFALSIPLLQTRRVDSGENHFLPMGVDTDQFRPLNAPLPPELEKLKKPIVGFFGQIGSYVDIDLILQCARRYTYASFVVIGRALADISKLSTAENITYLGEIRYESLPRYAAAFDVGINPRVVNQLTLAMNPLKVLEYLSMGMPVVSTDLPAVRQFSQHVYIAGSRDHFIELVGLALQESSQEKRAARRRIAEEHSWESITNRVSSTIARIDAAKRSRSDHPTVPVEP